MQHNVRMHLPRPDGTRDVFCEVSTAKRKPCQNYVTLNADNVLIRGHVVYSNTSAYPRFVCSYKCMARYAKTMDEWTARNYGQE